MKVRFFVSGLLAVLLATLLTVPASPYPHPPQGGPKPLVAPFSEAEAKKARGEWAKHLRIPERMSLELGKKVKLDLVLIPPGKFKMGSPKNDKDAKDDEVHHEVEITKPFYMAVHETTQEQYEAVMGSNPSAFQNRNAEVKHTSKFPVESVTWNEAAKFCKKTDVNEMALPTEAQWEYACRAGTETKYHFGDEITSKNANANIKRELKCGPSNVASYAANRFGLYDMHGSVWEWCQDGYRKDYEKLKGKDPVEEHTSIRHLSRGGCWNSDPDVCRAAHRGCSMPDSRHFGDGFRVVVSP